VAGSFGSWRLSDWHKVADVFKAPTYIIAAIVVLACAVAAATFIRRRRAKANTQ